MSEVISRDARSYRLSNIDFLCGLVIVIMAIDHVRDSFLIGTGRDPMTDPAVGISVYMTRWVTYFCAPVFVLLAGTSAGLMASRKSQEELGAFLFFPEGYSVGLGGVYLVWILVLAILYPLCHCMAELKRQRKDWWLSYL